MGSNSTILFYCVVALSVVAAAATQLPRKESDVISVPTESEVISEAALATSDARAEKPLSPSRRLQALPDAVPCPVKFGEMKGYEEMGKMCSDKATMNECCSAFKKLACPSSALINSEHNTCAEEMFDAIRTKAKVENTRIFLNECPDSPGGVTC